MIKTSLIMSTEEAYSTAIAAGVPVKAGGTSFEPCPLLVGDFICYPSARGLTYRVTWRTYVQTGTDGSPPEWLVGVEPAENPLQE